MPRTSFFSRKVLPDGLMFILIFVIVLFSWQLLLQVPVTFLYGIGDTTGLVAHHAEMIRMSPTASSFLYSGSRVGGTAVGPIDFPIYQQILAWADLHPMLAINLSIMFTQTMISFFCLKILSFFISAPAFHEKLTQFLLVMIFAFNPAISWRLAFGHLNLVWGVIWGLSLVYALAGYKKKELSITGTILIFISLVNAFQCINLSQIIIYLLVSALVSALFYHRETIQYLRNNFTIVLKITLITIAAISFALINISNIVAYVPFLSRSIGQSVIYSYNIQTLQDFLSSFLYSFKSMEVERPYFALHETNLAYGLLPLFILVLLSKSLKSKILLLNLTLIILAVILSSDIPVLSNFILLIIPFLKNFRCPSRFFLILNYLQMLTISYFVIGKMAVTNRNEKLVGGLLFLGLILLFTFTELNPDILTIIFVTAGAVSYFFFPIILENKATLFLSSFVALNFLGFKDKIPENLLSIDLFQSQEELFRSLPGVSNKMLEHHSSLLHSSFQMNQGALFNYSGVDGYIYPTKRFLQGVQELMPDTRDDANSFTINSQLAGFNTWSKLFNIVSEIRLTTDGRVGVLKLRDSIPFYTPETLTFTDGAQATFRQIATADLSQSGYVETQYRQHLNSVVHCDQVRLVEQSATQAIFDVSSAKDCLLVLPTQYSNFLVAKSSETEKRFKVIPVNWLMTGVIVSDFKGNVIIEAQPALAGEGWFKLLALILLIVVLFWSRKDFMDVKNSQA